MVELGEAITRGLGIAVGWGWTGLQATKIPRQDMTMKRLVVRRTYPPKLVASRSEEAGRSQAVIEASL